MTPEQQKKIDEAWMHAAMITSEFSFNSHDNDKRIFEMGFKAGLSLMQERLEEAEKRFIDFVSEISEPSFNDERISWVEVQIDKEVLKEAREYLSKWGKNE